MTEVLPEIAQKFEQIRDSGEKARLAEGIAVQNESGLVLNALLARRAHCSQISGQPTTISLSTLLKPPVDTAKA